MTNYNQEPYYDDFEFNNNYKRILFKPGLPVQTRELNQIQSIFKGELGALADHVFKNGSKVSNCRTNLFKRDYVRLLDVDVEGNPLVKPLIKPKLVGEVSGVEAVLTNYYDAVPATLSDDIYEPTTINVIYTKSGVDAEQSKFIHGENIIVLDDNDIEIAKWTVRCPECPDSNLSPEISPTGKSYYFGIDEGIVYYNQMFPHVNQQEILITKYIETDENGYDINDNKFKVGLDVDAYIVTSNDDTSLLDNSLGYPNAGAEGADRLKVNLKLTKREYDSEDGDTFILLAKYKEHYTAEYTKADSEYNDLLKEFARRTYESAGNFTVDPFSAQFLNELKKYIDDTYGWSLNGDDNNLVVIVSPGIAYVDGYRVEKTSETIISFEKSRDTVVKEDFATTLNNRQYVYINIVSNNIIVNNNQDNTVLSYRDVLLYDGELDNGEVTGQIIGSMKVIDQSHIKDNSYVTYLYDISISVEGKTFRDVKSMQTNDGSFVAEPVLSDGGWQLFDSDSTGLVFKLPLSDVKTLRNSKDPNSGSITYKTRRKLVGTLDSNGKINFTGTSNEYFEGFNPSSNLVTLDGERYDLSNNQYNVNNNDLEINLGSEHASKTIVILVDVTKINQTEKTKVLKTSTFTTDAAPSGVKDTVINLGVADGYDLLSLKLVNPSDSDFEPVDVSSEYEFDTGQTDMYYGEVKLKRLVNRANIDDNIRLEISFRYFEHEGNQGYFDVDSYSQLLNDGVLKFDEIPTYNINGEDVKLNECIDFRPILINGNFVTTPTIPVSDSTFVCDIEHYLPRIDILQLSFDGMFTIKKGIPSETPVAPDADIHNMKIYDIYMNAYVYTLNDVDVKFIDNRRYTMRDVGSIENRLNSLEYYVSLNMLEQDTLNKNIVDSNGLSRFKNGFLVDDFKKFQAADVKNDDFKASLDRKRGELRPHFNIFNVPMVINKDLSTNVNLNGSVATLPFVEVVELENKFATKSVSINPYLVFNKEGALSLSPNIDTWADDKNLPSVVTNIDAGAKALQDLSNFNGLVGTDWGSWRNLNTTVMSTQSVDVDRQSIDVEGGVNNRTTTTTTTNTTTVTNQRRTGVSRSINSRTDTYTVSDMVKDVRIIPYIRSRIVQFYASKLKPNTRVYAMFDGIDVTEHCRPVISNNNENLTKLKNAFGELPLVTDQNGELIGEFRIPEKTFFTGEKTFYLADVISSNSEPTTSASTKYFAGGVSQTKQSSTLNITSPTVVSRQVSDERRLSNTTRDVQIDTQNNFVPNPVPPTPPRPVNNGRRDEAINTNRNTTNNRGSRGFARRFSRDPIAQAFQVDESCFITSIDLYFAQVDMKTSDNIWVEIRTMSAGYPSDEVLAHKDYNPNDIINFVSDDSTTPFRVIFNTPIYVDENRLYCFVVGGHSPDTRLWVSRLGDEVINIKGKIVEEPPSLNGSFRSLNGSTWNAEQIEFIKYGINRAEFTSNTMNIVMNNDDLPFFETAHNPIEVQKASNRVRIHAPNHGMSVNDKFNLSLFDNRPFTIEVSNNTVPQLGQTFKTPDGEGIIKEVTDAVNDDQYIITLEKVKGKISVGENFQCDPLVKNYNDFVLFANGNTPKPAVQVTECQGIVITDISDTLGYDKIANVDLKSFNTEHLIVEVDSIDSFIIEVSGTFTDSGRYGSDDIVLFDMNRRFESYTISSEMIEYESNAKFEVVTVDGDYNYKKPQSIKLNTNNYLATPSKVASSLNEKRVLGSGNKSLTLDMEFTAPSNRLSPVINLDSLSFMGVTNQVGYNTLDRFNVEPNAPNRYISEYKDNGSEPYKYLTNKVVLANPANDVKIYFDVYLDIDADFDVYIKYGNGDTLKDETNDWVKLNDVNKNKISSGINQMIEYELSLSDNYTNYDDNTEFIWFRTKIVGRTKNSAKPPIFKNLRVIAVT